MKLIILAVLIVVLGTIEATLPRVLLLDLARPLLLVSVVLHCALTLQTVEGGVLALLAGFVQDATGGWPTGLCSFTMVALFVIARLLLVGVRPGGRGFEVLLSLLLAAGHHALVLVLVRTFGPPVAPLGETPWLLPVVASSVATAVLAPFVLALVRRATSRFEDAGGMHAPGLAGSLRGRSGGL